MKSLCFMTISSGPDYLGGYSLYHKNLIRYIHKNKIPLKVTWVYFGNSNKKFSKNDVEYIQIKSNKLQSFMHIGRNFQFLKFINKNYFDIINTIGGPWTYFYRKKKNQKITQTLHGTVYYFYKNHMNRFKLFKKIIFSPIFLFSWIIERPHKKTDKIICVSNKVKQQFQNLYKISQDKIKVIRTGVDLKEFRPQNKTKLYSELKLNKNNFYGLYVGGGSYYTKGLDRTINLGKEIYKLNQKFKLIIIGSDYKKVKHLLNEPFIIFLQNIPREQMPKYYGVANIFFCMSRYEGGAPTLVTSEAMASKCLLVSSEDSQQEIIKNNQNGIIISKFGNDEAKKILKIFNDKNKLNNITKNAYKTIQNYSLDKWGKRYVKTILS